MVAKTGERAGAHGRETRLQQSGRCRCVLIATDAAAEGLNLQETARYLLHFDCPWNPSRLEQRNGRIDRHGQARDVTIFHFVSDQDQDLKFLAHVLKKAHDIREDLGSANELFDEAAHRRLIEGEVETVQGDLIADLWLRWPCCHEADSTIATGADGKEVKSKSRFLAAELDRSSSLATRSSRPWPSVLAARSWIAPRSRRPARSYTGSRLPR